MSTWPDLTQIESASGTSSARSALPAARSRTERPLPAKSSPSSVEAAVTAIRSPGGEVALAIPRSPLVVLALAGAVVVGAAMIATVGATLLVLLRDFPALILVGLVLAYVGATR